MIALNEAYAYLMSQARLDRGFPGSEGPSSEETGRARAGSACFTESAEGADRGAARQRAGGSGGRTGKAEPAGGHQTQAGATGVADTPGKRTDLGFHKDPSYAYYKQGFVHFSRAIQGVEALYRSLSQRRVVHFKPRDDAYQRFADGLVELRRAHEYFSRVVQDFTASIWKHDASLKLGRIERFSTLYRRILGNLTTS